MKIAQEAKVINERVQSHFVRGDDPQREGRVRARAACASLDPAIGAIEPEAIAGTETGCGRSGACGASGLGSGHIINAGTEDAGMLDARESTGAAVDGSGSSGAAARTLALGEGVGAREPATSGAGVSTGEEAPLPRWLR